jgi:endo-1,4-beta-D-glucanase Y
MRASQQKKKLFILAGVVLLYILVGAAVLALVNAGVLKRAPFTPEVVDNTTDTDIVVVINPSEALSSALSFVNTNLRKPNGHINLYLPLYEKQNISQHNHTNSEAISYYLQIAAQEGDKERFDQELSYLQRYMLHPAEGYMMWRLDDKDRAEGEGRNMAPDADLRALRALYIAKDRWGDPKYDPIIDMLATGLERVAVNEDNVLVAYGGGEGDGIWRAQESYLAYSDFQVYDRLANTRGGVWEDVNLKMRNITLGAQIWNGLYNSEYWGEGRYGNAIDGNVYSINSLWIMVRFAESNDPVLMESAKKSLKFYQDKYASDGTVYIAYNSDGTAANTYESPWNYALIARAAKALGEKPFAQLMERRMLDYQDLDEKSPLYGAIVEGGQNDERVGQFTMQEAILTLHEMQGKAPRFNE